MSIESKYESIKHTIGLLSQHDALESKTMVSFMVCKHKETEAREIIPTCGKAGGVIKSIEPVRISKETWEADERFYDNDGTREWLVFANLIGVKQWLHKTL